MSWADTAIPSFVAIHGYNSTYRDTWCTPEADRNGLRPLLGPLSPFSRIFAFQDDIKKETLFDKSHLENAAADLLKSLSKVVMPKVVLLKHSHSRLKVVAFY